MAPDIVKPEIVKPEIVKPEIVKTEIVKTEIVKTEIVKTEIVKTEDEWRAQLGTDRYHVLREKGTEPAWSGALLDVHDPGLFRCAACGAELFRTDDKFESGSGWPSFTRALRDGVVQEHEDRTFGMRRTEVTCARCDSHLGHVFPDGPAPTGQRYCMNSLSLEFEPERPTS